MHLQHYLCSFLFSFRSRDWFSNLLSSENIGKVIEHFSIMYCSSFSFSGRISIVTSCMAKDLICCLLFVSRKHGLSDDTIDFIGHALALHRDDRYLSEPALDTVKRMKVCPG